MNADTETRPPDPVWDVAVVGGGAAGLNAALVLARARRRVIVIDAGAPRNRFAAHMHGFLTRDGESPLELLRLGRAEVLGYGATILDARATAVSGAAGAFEVTIEPTDAAAAASPDLTAVPTDAATAASPGVAVAPVPTAPTTASAPQRSIRARRLVIATGLRDELPAIPGLAEQWGRGAVACPYCDGWEARDLRIGVLTTSPMSAHQSALVRQWSDDVTVLGPQAAAFEPELLEGFAARGTRVLPQEVRRILTDTGRPDGTLTGVELADGSAVELDRLFVGSRLVPNDALLRTLGADFADTPLGPWVVSDATGLTSVPGVWVAGNSATAHLLVIAAAASGLTAATVVNAELVADDTRAAVAALRG